ncbi:MAG: hypothetical protein U0V73_08100 [Acidimicrobiia bacterium]
MNRATRRAKVSHAILPLLEDGERVLEWGPVWIARPRPRVPVVVLKRTLLGMAVTDRRWFVVDQPRRRRSATRDVVLVAHHDACRLVRYRGWTPMLHVQVRRPDGRRLVAEFRPRDRPVGHLLAASLSPSAVRGRPAAGIPEAGIPEAGIPEAGIPEADIPTEEVPVVTAGEEPGTATNGTGVPPSPS